jgi:hypothetical protein
MHRILAWPPAKLQLNPRPHNHQPDTQDPFSLVPPIWVIV